MLLKLLNTTGLLQAEIEDVRTALEIVEQTVLHFGGGLLERNFVAGAITNPRARNDKTWECFQPALMGLFWLGDESSFRQAQRDYLENAKRKLFTSWRTGDRNHNVIMHHLEQMLPEESRWVGAIPGVAFSAEKPEQDLFLCDLYDGARRAVELLRINKDVFVQYYPPEGVDTVGRESFNYPPDFSIFPPAMTREETLKETLDRR